MRDFTAATVICLALASRIFAAPTDDGSVPPPRTASQRERAFAPVEVGSDTSSQAEQGGSAVPRPASVDAISSPQLRALVGKTDDYYSTKHAAVACGVTGTVFLAGGYAALVASILSEVSRDADGNSKGSSGLGTLGNAGIGMMALSVPLFVASTVEIVRSIVKGVQLKQYEDQVGYRLSVLPVLQPRTGGGGAMAFVQF